MGCRLIGRRPLLPYGRAASQIPLPKLRGQLGEARSAEQLMALHARHAASFDQRHVARAWQQLGKLSRGAPPVQQRSAAVALTPLLETTLDQLRWPTFGAQAVASTAAGAAKCGVGSRPPWSDLWTALAGRAAERMTEFKPHELSMTLWALAKAGGGGTSAEAVEVWRAADAEVARRGLRDFDAQALSNIAWAATRAGVPLPRLFTAVAQEACARKFHDFAPQAVSNLVWAFSTAGEAWSHQHFLSEAAAAATRAGPAAFKPHELSALAWGYGKAGLAHHRQAHRHEALLEALFSEAVSRGAAAFSPQAQCNLAWACVTGGVAAPALLDAVADEGARTRLRGFTTQAVANTAWSFASAAHDAPALFSAVAEQIARMPLERYRPHELALLAWAFAAADVPCEALCGERFVNHLGQLEWPHAAQLAMLHQYALWTEEREWRAEGASLPRLPTPLLERAAAAFSEQRGRGRSSEVEAAAASRREVAPRENRRDDSALQLAVSAAVTQLGVLYEAEVVTPQGYQLDLVLQAGGVTIGVEVEGPHHFVGRSQQPKGKTLLKRRQLQAAGWRLMGVPYWEWDACNNNRPEQCALLSARLDEAVPGWQAHLDY